jgi:hypothetical protein
VSIGKQKEKIMATKVGIIGSGAMTGFKFIR